MSVNNANKENKIMKNTCYPGILASIGFLLMVGACSKSSAPTSPTIPALKPLKIVVSASSEIFTVGTTEVFKAVVLAEDGTTTPVTGGTWSSDEPGVATVEASTGRVTIVGHGYVIIRIEYKGNSGGLWIRGVTNYQGSWSGSYSVLHCNSSGDFSAANWCSNFPANEVFPANLNLTQNGDAVSGHCTFGPFICDVSGTVFADYPEDSLAIMGTVSYGLSPINVYWAFKSAAPGKITGIMTWYWRSPEMSGESRVSAEIRDLNRAQSVPPLEIQ
jgi:hypothetical protein